PVVPVVASETVMADTGSAVGDELQLSSRGVPLRARIVGTTSLFAPFDPSKAFVLTDLATVDAIQFVTTGRTDAADEWWLGIEPGSEPAILAALREPSAGTSRVIGRAELT